MKSNSDYNLREIKNAYWFNAPLILTAVFFILIPVAGTIITSLIRDVTFLPIKFLGLDNYKRMLGDAHFWQSVRFTLLFVFSSVTLELILGMIFALVLNETLPARGLFRVAILIPWAIPIAISGRIWQLIYNYEYGLFNYLVQFTGISNEPISWLGSSFGALASVIIADVWKTTPFMAIIILAGLSTIPRELYKQAMIDGTNFIQRFFNITLPLLKPVIVVALLFRTVDAIRIFDLVYVLTGGGPGGSTSSLSLYAYNYYVTGDFGYGSAVSVTIFVFAAILAVAYIKLGKFKEVIR